MSDYRMKPKTQGTWERVGRKHYEFVGGEQVRYDHSRWLWEIVGGREDGHFYELLWAAQYAVERARRV